MHARGYVVPWAKSGVPSDGRRRELEFRTTGLRVVASGIWLNKKKPPGPSSTGRQRYPWNPLLCFQSIESAGRVQVGVQDEVSGGRG